MTTNAQDSAGPKYGLQILLAAALITLISYQFSWGRTVLYPFFLLSTWFHEMGHGLMAIFMGGSFVKLEVFTDGSGLAYYSYSSLWLGNRLGLSLIAAAGLVAPPVVGAAFILGARKPKHAQIALYILVGFLALSLVLWVRNPFGWLLILLWTLAVLAFTRLLKGDNLQFFAQFIGVQAAMATFLNWRYLFTPTAGIGSSGLSDTGAIAKQLFLPYWFWGAAIAIFSAWILLWSLRKAYANKP